VTALGLYVLDCPYCEENNVLRRPGPLEGSHSFYATVQTRTCGDHIQSGALATMCLVKVVAAVLQTEGEAFPEPFFRPSVFWHLCAENQSYRHW
jgi:hypothetical protein